MIMSYVTEELKKWLRVLHKGTEGEEMEPRSNYGKCEMGFRYEIPEDEEDSDV